LFKLIFVLALTVSVAGFTPDARSAESSVETRKALQTLVASLNLEQYWPLVIEKFGQNGAAAIQSSALASLAGVPNLTDAQRRKAEALIAQWSVPMAEEIYAYHRKIDVTKLLSEMAETVYPKYFTAGEIRELAAFYGSSAFHKVAATNIRMAQEKARSAQGIQGPGIKYGSLLTQGEKEFVMAFGNSALGRKQLAVGPALSKDMLEFLNGRTAAGVNEVVDRYRKMLATELWHVAAD
jgi:hypothetical protein